MSPPQSLSDLNDDVICLIYEQLVERHDKEALIMLAATSQRMNQLAQRYLYREVYNVDRLESVDAVFEYFYYLRSSNLVTSTVR